MAPRHRRRMCVGRFTVFLGCLVSALKKPPLFVTYTIVLLRRPLCNPYFVGGKGVG
ncbi:MAG: hypothetical protein KatS3mg082_2090 [Nitrospiraceae bacterium]|nr:MAG: hypothetical protein KatS3mg082_2090 [Nitrospiraceae bacterium]